MWTRRIYLGSLLLVACRISDPDRDEHDNLDYSVHEQAARPVPQVEFCQQWAQAACSDAVVSACQASSAKDCEQTQAEFCRSLVHADVASNAGSDCIAAVANAYRDADLRGDELTVVLRLGGPCALTISGTSRVGDTCSDSTDCELARGYSCVKKSDSGTGTCQIAAVVDPGRDCQAAPKTCSEGFFCDGHNCVETLEIDDSCTIHEQCGESAYCDDTGHCAARRAVNDSCQHDIECERGICSEFEDEQVCTDRVVLSRADPVCANLR
jgi:hypothetical protein